VSARRRARVVAFVAPVLIVVAAGLMHGIELWRLLGAFTTIAVVIAVAHLFGHRGGV
jgi:hypothetical protein